MTDPDANEDGLIDPGTVTVRETVGIFETQAAMQAAIDELHLAGFDRMNLSLLDHDAVHADTAASASKSPETLADDPATPRTPYVAPESMGDAHGSLIAGFALLPVMGVAAVTAGTGTLIAATVATGGIGALVGGGIAYALAQHRTRSIDTQTEEGNLMLWVRTTTAEQEKRATEILEHNAAQRVTSHD